jgi:RimJ/RimL family protein N-acetyltransferase
VVGEPAEDGAVTDELLVGLPPKLAVSALVHTVESAGFPVTVVVQADAQALADPVTAALALARCVALDPGSADRAVATMLRAELAEAGAPPTAHQAAHQADVGVGARRVRLRRGWPFTATEISQGAALLELAGAFDGDRAAGRLAPPRVSVQLTDGAEVVLRAATAADAPLVAALHARCSPHTRAMRSLSTRPVLTAAVLQQLIGADGSTSVLAMTTDGGAAVGLANLVGTGSGTAEVALLVEDLWQGRGVGTALARNLVELARIDQLTEFTAVSQAGNGALTRVLRRAGLRPRGRLEGGALCVRAALYPKEPTPSAATEVSLA